LDTQITIGMPKEHWHAVTPEQMRAAIFKSARDSSLVRSVMMAADLNGWSAEDRYTMLAYEALRMLERYAQVNIEMLAMMPAVSPSRAEE
jgi:ABC-type tungstate transport system permease subunit